MALLKLIWNIFQVNFQAVHTVHVERLAVCMQSLSYWQCPWRKRGACCLVVLSVDKIWSLWANNIVRCVVVCHMGAWSVAIRWVKHRVAVGATAVFESAQVLCMVRLVAQQDPKRFIDFEPLPLPPCENTQRDQGSSAVVNNANVYCCDRELYIAFLTTGISLCPQL